MKMKHNRIIKTSFKSLIMTAIITVLFITALGINTYATGMAQVSGDKETAAVGDSYTVTVEVQNEETDAVAPEISISYDTNRLSFVSCSGEYGGGAGGFIQLNASGKYTIEFTVLSGGQANVEVKVVYNGDGNTEQTYAAGVFVEGEDTAGEQGNESSDDVSTGVEPGTIPSPDGNMVSAVVPDELMPAGFSKTTIDFGGQTIEALQLNTGGMLLIYETDSEGNNGTFKTYDQATGSLDNFLQIDGPKDGFIIVLKASDDIVPPANCQKTPLVWNNKEYEAYTFTLDNNTSSSDYVLLYAVNAEGNMGWYMYDMNEETYQKFAESVYGSSGAKDADGGVFSKIISAGDNDGGVNFVIIALIVIAVVFLALIATVIVMGVKLKEFNSYEYIDEDEDEDENDGIERGFVNDTSVNDAPMGAGSLAIFTAQNCADNEYLKTDEPDFDKNDKIKSFETVSESDESELIIEEVDEIEVDTVQADDEEQDEVEIDDDKIDVSKSDDEDDIAETEEDEESEDEESDVESDMDSDEEISDEHEEMKSEHEENVNKIPDEFIIRSQNKEKEAEKPVAPSRPVAPGMQKPSAPSRPVAPGMQKPTAPSRPVAPGVERPSAPLKPVRPKSGNIYEQYKMEDEARERTERKQMPDTFRNEDDARRPMNSRRDEFEQERLERERYERYGDIDARDDSYENAGYEDEEMFSPRDRHDGKLTRADKKALKAEEKARKKEQKRIKKEFGEFGPVDWQQWQDAVEGGEKTAASASRNMYDKIEQMPEQNYEEEAPVRRPQPARRPQPDYEEEAPVRRPQPARRPQPDYEEEAPVRRPQPVRRQEPIRDEEPVYGDGPRPNPMDMMRNIPANDNKAPVQAKPVQQFDFDDDFEFEFLSLDDDD